MREASIDVPVVFMIFNRPEVTRLVFEEIRQARPRKLFVIADGARNSRPGEHELVAQTRAIVDCVDWPCDVKRNYSDANMGCKSRVSSGITWVFENVEEAIILEDDCVPGREFFAYCAELLRKYRLDRRVFAISGSNFSPLSGDLNAYFSDYPLMWGWATWRDRWREYQLEPSDWRSVVVRKWWRHPIVLLYWLKIFSELSKGRIDTWDYQWMLTHWRCDASAIRPTVNLVKNIGFGSAATHTHDATSKLANLPVWAANKGVKIESVRESIDRAMDAVDEREWAGVWLSVIEMYIPYAAHYTRRR